MSQEDWTKMRDVVLQRLRANWQNKSETLRNLPTLPFTDEKTMETIYLSPNEMIREVSNLSGMGKKIITAKVKEISRLQQ